MGTNEGAKREIHTAIPTKHMNKKYVGIYLFVVYPHKITYINFNLSSFEQ